MIDGKNSVLIRPETVISDVCGQIVLFFFFRKKSTEFYRNFHT